jgi:hypothetical protein
MVEDGLYMYICIYMPYIYNTDLYTQVRQSDNFWGSLNAIGGEDSNLYTQV